MDNRNLQTARARIRKPAMLVTLAGLSIALSALAQPTIAPTDPPDAPAPPAETPAAADLPDSPPSVERLLKAAYLTADELKDLRIFHGAWRESDLDSPARAARAALVRGDYLDPSFDGEGVDPADRAEARLMAGLPVEALTGLEKAGAESVRSYMLRARAAEMLGRFDDAVAAIDFTLNRGEMTTAEDVTCAVRMLAQRIHLRGSGREPGAGGDDAAAALQTGKGPRLTADAQTYHQMIETLGRIRAEGDGGSARLYWPALMAEAELLFARDNATKAQQALSEVLALNPACAEAWALLGRMSVDAFNFDATEKIALRLDALAGNPAPRLGEGEQLEDAPPVAGASIDAAIIRARAANRQVDGARAAEVLDALIRKYPTHPDLLAIRAAAEATRFEFDALAKRLADFDEVAPGSPMALFECGRALAESRQYAASEEKFKAATDRLPAAPEIWADLGLMYVQWGKDELALDALERAYDLDPFNLRADNSLRLVRELGTYARVESEHFIVRFKPGVDEVFARDLLGPMEENHRAVTSAAPGGVDHQPFGGRAKTLIDLMPDHEWFGVRIAGMPAIHTIAASTGPVIAMEAPRTGPRHNGQYDWKRVLRHEYTHTVNLDRTRNRIPHWFTEANAVYMELSPRDYVTCQLMRDVYEADALFDFTEINIAFVRPKKPSDRSQGYAQGHMMYEYIIVRWGNKAPLELMDLYAEGVREEQAFARVLGIDRARFMADFKVWTREQLVAWGMLPPAGTPSIRELLAKRGDEAETEDEELTSELAANLLGEHPAHPDLLEVVLVEALSKAGGRATADLVPLIDRYMAARPVDPKPHRLLASMYMADPDPAEQFKAIPHLEYLDAREQKVAAYATELSRRYSARGEGDDVKRAHGKAERATQLAPYEAPPRELAAAAAIQARAFDSAERHIQALILLEPDRDIHRQRLDALRRLRATEAR